MTTRLTGLVACVVLLAIPGPGGNAVAAPAPRLTFPCSAIPPSAAHPVVTCRLAGHGFARREHLAITYRVEIRWMQGVRNQNHKQFTTLRRAAETDGQGRFQRPPFSFTIPTGPDVRVWRIGVQVQVDGARGDQAATSTVGQAD